MSTEATKPKDDNTASGEQKLAIEELQNQRADNVNILGKKQEYKEGQQTLDESTAEDKKKLEEATEQSKTASVLSGIKGLDLDKLTSKASSAIKEGAKKKASEAKQFIDETADQEMADTIADDFRSIALRIILAPFETIKTACVILWFEMDTKWAMRLITTVGGVMLAIGLIISMLTSKWLELIPFVLGPSIAILIVFVNIKLGSPISNNNSAQALSRVVQKEPAQAQSHQESNHTACKDSDNFEL